MQKPHFCSRLQKGLGHFEVQLNNVVMSAGKLAIYNQRTKFSLEEKTKGSAVTELCFSSRLTKNFKTLSFQCDLLMEMMSAFKVVDFIIQVSVWRS